QEHNRAMKEREQREAELRVDLPVPPAFMPELGKAPETRQEPDLRSSETRQESPSPSKDDYTSVLAQIVQTQQQIQMRHLALEPALALIIQRVIEIARAAGAAVGILDGRMLRYRAAAGQMTLAVGSEVSLEKALCAASLRVGDVIRSADVNPDFLIDAA